MTIRAEIEQHIRKNMSVFREVAGAANLKSILQGRVSAPGCYVYRQRISHSKNEYDDQVVQLQTERYGIVIVVKNVRDERMGDSSDEAELLSDELAKHLQGWTINESISGFEMDGGELINLDGQYLFWQNNYTTSQLRG